MEIKENLILIKVYARDNLGSAYPSDELIRIARKIKEVWKQGYEKAVELVEKIIEEESEEWEFDYEITDEGILIKNHKRDMYGSHGYEEALIFEFPLKEMIEEAKNWVDEAGYILIEKDAKETPFEWISDEYILYEDCIITGEELKTIIDKFAKTIEEDLEENDILGTPIISNNPYAYGYENWEIEIADEIISFYVSYPVRTCASYMMSGGRLVFKKNKEAKKTLEKLQQLIIKHSEYIKQLFKELLDESYLILNDYEDVFEGICDELPPDFDEFPYNLKQREIFLFLKNVKYEEAKKKAGEK
jgi:hypothetical protein